MAKSLEQILGYVPLTGLIQAIKTGIPDNLPPSFTSTKSEVPGNSGRYTQVKGTRRTARLAQYGSPAVKRELKGVESKDVKSLHTFEQIEMDPLTLQQLRNYDNYDIQRLGIQEVDRQQSEFAVYFDNLRLSATYSMLANGKIWFDSSGNLLPTSSGAQVTVDYGISANNQNQLNGIITASWATANTDIPSQLRNLRIRAAELTGYPLKYAFYGVNIPSYLTQNNYVLDYLSRNPNFAQRFLEVAEIPDGLFGLTWVPVYTSFFEDSAGTNQTFFGSDTVVFTPEISREIYELLEGTFMVPRSFNAAANMAAGIASLEQVTGRFAYAVPIHNPPTVQMLAGDTFLPVWKVPDAIFQADVTP